MSAPRTSSGLDGLTQDAAYEWWVEFDQDSRLLHGFQLGAAVAFGIVGMFEVIRERWLYVIPTDYSVYFEDKPRCESCGCTAEECLALVDTDGGTFICETCNAP